MATLTFETLTFRKSEDDLHVDLLRHFTTTIPFDELHNIAPFETVDPHTIRFDKIEQEKAEVKFSFLLNKYFEQLKTKLTGNKAVYIHRNSGIPLIGNPAFGIVYRNSSIIEIKPVTSCNLNCIYCSISEGLSSKKIDFVVEKDYLLEELEKLISFVDEPVEVHIGVQGEPFFYADIYELIEDLQKMKMVKAISIDTNGTLLNKEKIDQLARNDKLQLNFSFDTLDKEKAIEIAGTKTYNLDHVKKIITYASNKLKVVIAPVFVQRWNEEDIEKIIIWAKSLPGEIRLGIQNFLRYKTGRNPAKEMSWDKFYTMLQQLEEKHKIQLKLTKEDFNIRKTKELPKPFKVGDVVSGEIKCPDRFPNTVVAVSGERSISVSDCPFRKDKKISVKITRDKHNIYCGKTVKIK